MNQPDVMILDNVSKAFGEDWERETVVENLSLTVKRNQLTAIVGPSGCGKSTIVNLLAGFELFDRRNRAVCTAIRVGYRFGDLLVGIATDAVQCDLDPSSGNAAGCVENMRG